MSERSRDKADPAPRKRALVSCDRCKVRRARCIRDNPDEPCADCKMSGVLCESKLPRKQRVYGSVETLSLRYRALESLVKGLFPHDNVQDVNVLFKLAAERNIPMPASDDYRPANIFSSPTQPGPSQETQRPLSTPHSGQSIISPHATESTSTTSPISTTREIRHNPFSEVQQAGRIHEELIPTRHGVPHYFGPSSSFRLATTIRVLVARWRAAGGNVPTLRGSASDATSRESDPSLQRASTYPSDEEYTIGGSGGTESPLLSRKSRKRSRTQMEMTDDVQKTLSEPTVDTIGDLLPSRSLADALVSAYFDHVHIYLPLFHRSMFQFHLEATYSKRSELIKDSTEICWLVCLCLVFSFGCQQLQEHDPERSQELRVKYLNFVKSYFRHLLITTSIVNVQALVLLNVHHHTIGQVSSSWLLIGLATRMAITMGLHRDATNVGFDPIERNTRRQVWWSIYAFERILCSILGRPTAIDDREMAMRIPDAPMIEQKSMSANFLDYSYKLIRMSYTIRQRAYFDSSTSEERSPSLALAESLMRECNTIIQAIPPELSLSYVPTLPPEQKARVLLCHVYYYYTRCIVSRDFLVKKAERNIAYLQDKQIHYSEEYSRTLALSEDCVESAHQSLRCIMEGAGLKMIGYSWLDLFFVFHSVLIVCADFVARPKNQQDTAKDIERKEMVRAMLRYIRGMKLAATYKILGRIATQFATLTGIAEEHDSSVDAFSAGFEVVEDQTMLGSVETAPEISDVQEDWFSNAASNLGLDFFDLQETQPLQAEHSAYPEMYGAQPSTSEVDDWTARTLRGMHAL
ncbi:fungal-specific transcription factor domain-containing protein [Boeremia exigua]|uniref:fungal-specific transcription factor domain-containing protein n=1 Tax=Boeremia exigua TaxID=749465 RepID=UPI001E8E2A85|nr:fungal-specific transcription factor domain-containing protein [Boeremia exigua]KAH6620308.1 fungal-specific transcription factor domain-containing protein [Boeremia exigua]